VSTSKHDPEDWDARITRKIEDSGKLHPKIMAMFRDIMEQELNFYDRAEDRSLVATRTFVMAINQDFININEQMEVLHIKSNARTEEIVSLAKIFLDVPVLKTYVESKVALAEVGKSLRNEPIAAQVSAVEGGPSRSWQEIEGQAIDLVRQATKQKAAILECFAEAAGVYLRAQKAALRYPRDKEALEKAIIDDLSGVLIPVKATGMVVLGQIPGLKEKIAETAQRRTVAAGAVQFGPILECRELLDQTKPTLERAWRQAQESLDRLEAIGRELAALLGDLATLVHARLVLGQEKSAS
jgi:hypothetical protein